MGPLGSSFVVVMPKQRYSAPWSNMNSVEQTHTLTIWFRRTIVRGLPFWEKYSTKFPFGKNSQYWYYIIREYKLAVFQSLEMIYAKIHAIRCDHEFALSELICFTLQNCIFTTVKYLYNVLVIGNSSPSHDPSWQLDCIGTINQLFEVN